ncbi:MAG: hypothetical protein RMJ15_02060 [Nitrososphaerota archaeon]|nr:hypothetical protein [Candidatus Bathyarchaeota archaeon]MDW8022518.1 hypothetical protein [Nitrososphaerota archaeon]
MTETKYGKYFITYDPEQWPEERRPVIIRLEDRIVKGSNFYLVHWMFPGVTPPDFVGHPPHIHKDAEILMHIGTDPNNPMDLGAEVEFYMGPELERHVITKTTAVYIPPNFIHGPWKPIKTVRPWIFIEINQGPAHTEKLYPQVLPKELRDRVNWSMWKEEGF